MLIYSDQKFFHPQIPGEPLPEGFQQTPMGWETSDIYAAARSKLVPQDEKIKAAFALMSAKYALSRAESSQVEVETPHLPYLDYQKVSVEAWQGQNSILIADEMGLGKTIQAIAILNSMKKERQNILVICPATLRGNWESELQTWLCDKSSRILPVYDKSDFNQFISSNIVIVSYNQMIRPWCMQTLQSREWDVLILDEAHNCKNLEAKRTYNVLSRNGIIQKCKQVIALTGTPMNRPVDLYPIISALRPRVLGPYTAFKDYAERYCAAFYNTRFNYFDTRGASNLDELNYRLRASGFMLRRMKKDVLKQLPDKIMQIVPIVMAKKSAIIMEAEKQLLTLNNVGSSSLREFIDGQEPETLQEQLSQFGQLQALRQEIGIQKQEAVAEYVEDLLETQDKIVLFAYHKSIVAFFLEKLADFNPVCITGDTPQDQRQPIVARFQQDPKIRVFIGNILAAGEGLTLTAASHVVFGECTWSPKEIDQAVDRCHRIGQKNVVHAHFLTLHDTLDEYMLRSILTKKITIHKAIN